ncbi:hypothetical protein [Dactylosporangium matsuzakiense]|uniref:Uncharacterized protein n=1 Tax=Dactylosporangium matsuzakiense TaxID=53360 RepID=A0A9W6NP86_9ACTN|nr:hypothetical protein [Dactylosporangium matsuzakiense]UWZ41011.1 hypothetical protein Dmats_25135 [Dactylosporangium matsuzakiense]GLL04780.1 hypothetical protein GCM10017581_065270 [Dactylosporangium matsuzakiense]
MKIVTLAAVVRCGHDGRVHNSARQSWVRIGGSAVLVDADPEGCRVSGCPNIGPTMKPCTTTLAVNTGYSPWLRIGGQRIVLSDLDGLTDGTVPGTVHYTVRDPGQGFVESVA